MRKHVLSIGQCGFDHGSISSVLRKQFNAEVSPAEGLEDAEAAIAARVPDLILVNRKLDADHGDGLEVIRALKQNPASAGVPVMLVTNYPEFHARAVELGAVPGFGKNDLTAPATTAKLQPYLG